MNELHLLDKILIQEAEEEELWKDFEIVVRDFDWHYNFSDDPEVWRKGAAYRIKLTACVRLMSLLDEERTNDIYFTAEEKAYEGFRTRKTYYREEENVS